MSKLAYLPVWKQNATAEERFLELAALAKEHPERFSKMIVVYHETLPGNQIQTRYITTGGGVLEILGLLEMGKTKLLRWCLDGED